MNIKDLLDVGDLWRVSQPLSSGLDIPIVTPRTAQAGPDNIGGYSSVNARYGITILGVSASLVATGPTSVTLRSVDPMRIDGQTNNYDIWRGHAGAAGTFSWDPSDVIWTLSPTNYRTSPQGDGATLQLVCGGTITTGFITVWGIYGPAEVGGRRAFTGSPADYSTGN